MVQEGLGEVQEALGMTSGEIVTESEDESTKKGRGRPIGSTSKPSEEVSAIRQEVQNLKNKIDAFDTGNGSTRMSNAADIDTIRRSVERMDLRVSVIQQWVESFHMFLTTSRITNSADRMAEEELTKIISNLPDQTHPLFIGVNAES